MPPAARITDMHICPMVTGIVPHVGGPSLPPGAPDGNHRLSSRRHGNFDGHLRGASGHDRDGIAGGDDQFSSCRANDDPTVHVE